MGTAMSLNDFSGVIKMPDSRPAPAVFGPWMNISGSSLATWRRGKTIKEPS